MLPAPFKFWLFDQMSVKTMRYVDAVPDRAARGLTRAVYDMIRQDFFRNGSLTSRSQVPELMAAIWIAGRESMLVPDRVDRTTKDAICAVLSQVNDCPYCEDMLVSLVHAGGDHGAARDILAQNGLAGTDRALRDRLDWVRRVATPGGDAPAPPFTPEEMPEVLGTLMAMSDINRFSHVVMADSPVSAPLGLRSGKALQLKMFGAELVATRRTALQPGRALTLLPGAELPGDLAWARPNPRVADALARYVAAVERAGDTVIPLVVRATVQRSLAAWRGEQMPISRAWVEPEIAGLSPADQAVARLAIVLAKAPYQVDDTLAEAVLAECADQVRFIRVLAWASFTGSRRFAALVAERAGLAPVRQTSATPVPVRSRTAVPA